ENPFVLARFAAPRTSLSPRRCRMQRFPLQVRAALILQALLVLVLLCAGGSHPRSAALARQEPAAKPPAPKTPVRVMEGSPTRIQARLEQRLRTLRALPPATGPSPHFILNLTKRWQPGQTLRVAFRGGDTALHGDIAKAVTEWTKYAN